MYAARAKELTEEGQEATAKARATAAAAAADAPRQGVLSSASARPRRRATGTARPVRPRSRTRCSARSRCCGSWSLVNAVALNVYRRDNFDHPAAGGACSPRMVAWTGVAIWAYAAPRRAALPLLVADLAGRGRRDRCPPRWSRAPTSAPTCPASG